MSDERDDGGPPMPSELLPCPFCGKPPGVGEIDSVVPPGPDDDIPDIYCQNSDCVGVAVEGGDWDNNVKRWNRRALPADVAEVLKALFEHEGGECDNECPHNCAWGRARALLEKYHAE